MPDEPKFPHLTLPLVRKDKAYIGGGGSSAPETVQNRTNRAAHAAGLSQKSQSVSDDSTQVAAARRKEGLPDIKGLPLLLRLDPGLSIDELRDKLGFEIVLEEEDGYVVVASSAMDLAAFRQAVEEFASGAGSAIIASVHELFGPSTAERLQRVLGELYETWWPALQDDNEYIVDVGIACVGTQDIPTPPSELAKRRGDESDKSWASRTAIHATKLENWKQARTNAYVAWDELKLAREDELEAYVKAHRAIILQLHDALAADQISDSFTVRLKMTGAGIRDLVLNHPHVFEVAAPDDVLIEQHAAESDEDPNALELLAPHEDAPAVGIIDSGIQENHLLLAPAVDSESSICLLPGEPANAVADLVFPGGHGTRVAGAVLYGESIPTTGRISLTCWLQNARVLDANCNMPISLSPAIAVRAAILKFRGGPRATRLFNHSITGDTPCRLKHMSAWAAEIDALSHDYDVLVIQAAGNLARQSASPKTGIVQHLAAGRRYPDYLDEASSRVANPAQSLQALTVGSVAYQDFQSTGSKSFAVRFGEVSAFSRSGPGIWGAIKPEVVELGGDLVLSEGNPPTVATPKVAAACFPLLVRSTLRAGPAFDRDAVGTSFAAPKVTHIAATLQALLPYASTLLYRALIVQSARWPSWAEEELSRFFAEDKKAENATKRATARLKKARAKDAEVPEPPPIDTTARDTSERMLSQISKRIGYGLPDLKRATENSATRVTLITADTMLLIPGQAHIYVVPVPAALQNVGKNVEVRVEVTLSYSATPRRTRRTPKRYLSVWLEWRSSRFGEPRADFERRIMERETNEQEAAEAPTQPQVKAKTRASIPWMLHSQPKFGTVKGLSRGSGTLQKDWAVVRLNQLGSEFSIAVVGHAGHSRDPDAAARYAIVVSFEIVGVEIPIYEQIRTAVTEIETELEVESEG